MSSSGKLEYGEWLGEELLHGKALALELLADEEKIRLHQVIDDQLKAEMDEVKQMMLQLNSKITQIMERIQNNAASFTTIQQQYYEKKADNMAEMLQVVGWLTNTVDCKSLNDVKALDYLCRMTGIKKAISIERSCDEYQQISAFADLSGYDVTEYGTPKLEIAVDEMEADPEPAPEIAAAAADVAAAEAAPAEAEAEAADADALAAAEEEAEAEELRRREEAEEENQRYQRSLHESDYWTARKNA